MKNLKKVGYISIELIIVAGIVLVFGVFAVGKLMKSGNGAVETSTDAINKALSEAKSQTA